MTTTTITSGSRQRAGRPAGLRALLLGGAAALALGGCSWSSGFESAASAPGDGAPQLAQRGAGAPAHVRRSPLAPRATMSEPGTAWPAAVAWVQAERQAKDGTAAAQLAVEPAPAPLTWEQGLAEPAVWAEPGEGARDGDDEVLQLAAVPVAGEELAEERGGFITSMGAIDIGFDMQTFVNGQLLVRNIFNMAGDIAERVQEDAGIGNGLTVRFNQGGGGFTINPFGGINNNSNNSNNSNNNTNANPNPVVNAVNTNTPPNAGNTVPNVTDVVTEIADAVTDPLTTNDPPPPPQPNVVISEIADGHIRVVNELNGGDTKIINEISGGTAHTTLINTASGLDIEHITNLVVGFSNPGNIVDTVRSGFKTNGDLGGLGNGMRSALIGAISR